MVWNNLPPMVGRRGWCALIAVLLLPLPAAAGQAPEVLTREADGGTTIRAVRAPSPMRIDGVLDEPLYSLPPMSDFAQVEPQLGAAATEKTELWFGFDADHVYISFRCWDTQAQGIVATEKWWR